MGDTYEQVIGTLDPGYIKPISVELQRSVREIERLQKRDTAWVTLSVSHPSAKPETISAILQLTPDNVSRAGDTIYKHGTRFITSDAATYWNISSANHVADAFFEKHLQWILDQLFGKLPSVRSLQRDGAQFSIKAHLEPWSRLVAPVLDVDVIQRLSQLRIPMEFVIHYQNSESEY